MAEPENDAAPGRGTEGRSTNNNASECVTTHDTPYCASGAIYHTLGWSPIPLPPRAKASPPRGWTGREGRRPSRADVEAWAEDQPTANIAIRLPDNVVGIDVDAYGTKRGAETLLEAERRWGALPDTVVSTSRSDGVSGIRLYRVPAGTRLQTELPGGHVEVVQAAHRYLVAAPSVHPEGRRYMWTRNGAEVGIPTPAELPELPAAWREGLAVTAEPVERGDSSAVHITEGQMEPEVAAALDAALGKFGENPRAHHDIARDASLALVRLAEQRFEGVSDALDQLESTYVGLAEKRTPSQARSDFRRLVDGARQIVAATPSAVAGTFEPPTDDATVVVPSSLAARFVDGGSFIHDEPEGITSLWGSDEAVLWADGEALIVCGPQGVGKTTLCGNLVAALIADESSPVLELPVSPVGRVLYLAMDRPRQAARALRRQLGEVDRATLADRLVVWKGPPAVDLARHTDALTELAEAACADVVVVDSLKDAALGLSDDEVGAGWNRARQALLASGRNIVELHHIKKISSDKTPDIADVYGSTWITSGSGSVLLLNGDPGDPVIRAHHVKQPANELGPWWLTVDHTTGAMAVQRVDLLAAGVAGITTRTAAGLLYETTKPTRAQKEKARRRLDAYVSAGRMTASAAAGVTTYYTASPRVTGVN